MSRPCKTKSLRSGGGEMRLDGWESRLMAAVESAMHTPYKLGENDCLRLACSSVEALTGVDYWPRFVGYKTKRQALIKIAKIATSLGEAVTATLGVQPSPARMAQRGDIVLFRDSFDEDHLGVATGAGVMVYAPAGLLEL